MQQQFHYKYVKSILKTESPFTEIPKEIIHLIILKYKQSKHYIIKLNQYQGIYWDINIDITDFDTLTYFIDDIQKSGYKYLPKDNYHKITKKQLSNLKLILTDEGKRYFNLIKNLNNFYSIIKSSEAYFEIRDINSYERLIVYTICGIFGLKFKTLIENNQILIPCTNFADSDSWYKCGCDNAPEWFHKNHSHNSYDDDIAYSSVFRARKVGILIYKC